ncbi:MAG TPA: hypothetical protein VHK01_18405, partial [Lacipirellulaceae bacterium]|nr:hypothetical protein [Lacipirellulaceae bacterium]
MKVTNICRKLAASLAAAGMLAFSTAHAADLNTNLLVNPSFEAVDPGFPVGDYSAVLITEGWTGDFGGGVGAYNVSLGYTAGTLPAGAGNYFYTFPANPTRARQNINLSGGASGSLIAAGNAFFNASAHFANWANPGTPNAGDGDYGRVIVMFQDSGGGTLGTPFTLNSASGVSPSGLLPWTQFGMDGPIPVGTTTAVVELLGVSASGATTARYREGYIDL